MKRTSAIDQAPAGRDRVRFGVLRRIGEVMMWTVLLAALAILAVGVLIPRVSGATPYTIATGSMRPDYPPGTLVVVKPVPFDQISIGDVITYQLASGEAQVVTHRVAAIGSNLEGEKYLRTQGDTNSIVDAEPVRPVQVRGKLWYSVPKLGYLSVLFTGSQRQTGVLVAAGALIFYAAGMYIGSVRDKTKKRKTKKEEDA